MMFIDPAFETTTALQWGVVIGASLAAAAFDLRTRRIPNAITLPLLVVGLLQAAWMTGLSGLADALGASVLLALPFVLMFLFAGGGAGDAKFMAAIGTWLGLKQGLIVLFCVAAAGIVLAVAKAVVRRKARLVMSNTFLSFYGLMLTLTGYRTKQDGGSGVSLDLSCDMTIPYGVAIFAGVCAAGGFVLLWQG